MSCGSRDFSYIFFSWLSSTIWLAKSRMGSEKINAPPGIIPANTVPDSTSASSEVLRLNPLDGIILGILLFFLIIGAMRGWFRQILQISTILIAFVAASLLHLGLADAAMFDGIRQKSDALADGSAFMIIFLSCSIFLTIISAFIFDLGRPDQLSFSDHALGALISVISGILVLGCVCLVANEWIKPGKEAGKEAGTVAELISTSSLVSPLSESCQVLIDLIPASSRKQMKNYIDEGKKQIEGIKGED